MKKLLMFQTAEELNRLKQSNLLDKTNILVAITPEADYAAEKLKPEYKTIEDFYSDTELMELGIQNFANVRDFCAELDLHLFQALKDIPEAEAISTHDDFYDLKRLFDALLNRTFTLTSAITMISPELIVYFGYPSFKRDIRSDIENNLLISGIIPIIAKELDIETVVLPSEDFDLLIKKALKYTLINQLSKFPRAQILVSELVKLRKRLLFNADIKTFSEVLLQEKKSITLIGDSDSPFDDGRVIRKWVDSGTGNFFTLRQIMKIGGNTNRKEIYHLYAAARKACTNAWERIDCNAIREFFQIEGIDLYPLVKSFLKDYICFTIPKHIVEVKKLKNGLRQIRPCIIMTSGISGRVATIARKANIKTVDFQHGGTYGYLDNPMLEHLFLGTDYFFCYGTGVSEFYETPSPNAHLSSNARRPMPMPIGSPSLDFLMQRERISKPKNSKNGKDKTVVYVTTNLGGDGRYFSYHMYPDIWFWRLQRRVIETCTECQNIQLIVKLYPQKGIRKDLIHNPIRDWLNDVSLPNCQALEHTPFTDLLSIGDLFIIDVPATTLLEALTTTKPIITFADHKWVKVDSAAAALLRKRVILAESAEQFLYEIGNFLQCSDWCLPQQVNDEFLRAYGTHLNDGRSAERAVNQLFELAMNRR